MNDVYTNLPIYLILIFSLITFLQSGLDKMLDWKGNVGWLKGHFEKTFMGSMVPLLVAVIMILEIAVGLLALAAIYDLWINSSTTMAYWCLGLAALTLLMLLFGQRMAKDYPGAFTITGYFMVVIFGIFLLGA